MVFVGLESAGRHWSLTARFEIATDLCEDEAVLPALEVYAGVQETASPGSDVLVSAVRRNGDDERCDSQRE